MKKFLALTLVLVMCVLSFASCTGAEDILQKADEALLDAPYKMTLKMKFDTDNEEIKAVFDAMNVEIPCIIDGNNMMIDVSMDILDKSVTNKMTVVGSTLYYNVSMADENIKMKAELSKDQYEKFMEENGASMPADYTDFDEIELKKEKDKITIKCQGLSDKALQDIKDVISSAAEEMGGKIDVENIQFTIVLKDEKYDSVALACTYKMVIGTQTYSIDMNIAASFDYDNISSVKAPADAADYQTVSFDDLGLAA